MLNLGSPSSSNAIQFGIEANELVETSRRRRHAQRDEEEEETRREAWKLLGRNWSKLRRDFVKWCTANQWKERNEGGRGLQIQTYPLISQLSKLQRQRALIDSQVENHALSPIKFDVSAIYKCLLHSTTPLPPRVCDLRSLSGKKGRCISIQ